MSSSGRKRKADDVAEAGAEAGAGKTPKQDIGAQRTADADAKLEYFNRIEGVANKMIAMLNSIRHDRGVLVHIYGRSIAKVSSIQVLEAHRYARLITGEELTVLHTLPVLQAIHELDLGNCRIDLGKLTTKIRNNGIEVQTSDGLGSPVHAGIREVVADELREVLGGVVPVLDEPQDLVLFGFGRIGRLVARVLLDKVGMGDKIRPKGIVVRSMGSDEELEKRTALLKLDSVHGRFKGTVSVDHKEKGIVANGNLMRFIEADGDPATIDYTQYGIRNAIVVDNTGKFRDREGLSKHLRAKGVSKVLLSAPGKGDIPNIVYGINNSSLDPKETIVSAASCTTNAIAPILKVMQDTYGIVSGHIESCHSYTNDQNLIDNYHSKPRRGRSAPLNMVITTTGAAGAVAKVLPELEGKLTGNSIRVPTPNVSLAIIQLCLKTEVTREELNKKFHDIALYGGLQEQIDYTFSRDVVSTDIVGSRHAAVFDGDATIVNESDRRNVVLYVWYDNEFGYACQLMRLLQQMAGINLPELPHDVDVEV